MTMFTRLGILVTGLSMKATIIEAWKKRLVGWFNVGLICIVAFVALFWILPRFLPKRITKKMKYARTTLAVLALGLLLLLFSLLSGIGFGFGLGGRGSSEGIGTGKGDTNKKPKYANEGELDIAVIGKTVYIDDEPFAIEQVRDQIKKKNEDTLTVVLIDAYSDYGIYTRVEAILTELLTEGKYERRKEN
ncbi:MAG: hypothetical protein J5649_03930 [Lachnospiraceae bacterium]|nr:hypothetical protein [Lachnospiraceae bacterium]